MPKTTASRTGTRAAGPPRPLGHPFFLAVLALPLVLASAALAFSQPDVAISEIDCEGEPQVIVLRNDGDEAADLGGWTLESDEGDTFDLSEAESLLPGESVLIEAGPGAASAFVWSEETVLRAGDGSSYARVVNADGQTVGQMNCPSEATPTPGPTPLPATPSPAPAEVPVGGGPPAAVAGGAGLIAALAATGGGALLLSGLMAVFQPWNRRRATPEAPAPAVPRRPRVPSRTTTAIVIALLVGLAIAVLALSARRSHS